MNQNLVETTGGADILFSHSYFYPLDKKQWERNMPFPPLGTIYAASLLRANGYQVELYDTALETDIKGALDKIETILPKYFVVYDDGFNYLTKMCLTNMREAAFEMMEFAKSKGCTVVVNSSDSTDHFEKYLQHGADYIIKGEGEFALLELIQAIDKEEDLENVNGIIYQKENKVHHNQPRKVLHDLDQLPYPAWDLIDIESYKRVWAGANKEFTLNIATTRGCPFKCNWCAKPIYGNRYNSHSPQYIVNLIEDLQSRFGVSRFWMCDDIFGLKPNWVQKFNAIIQEKKLSFTYFIQSRADLLLLEDTIEVLAQSGLEEAWIGAESGSQKILDAMDKGTTVEQIHEATLLLKAKGVRVAFFIQYGYLEENEEDIELTIKMIKKLLPDDLGISVSYPLPGTKFFDKVKAQLGDKANWEDSDELAMLFEGTYSSEYYKKLHRYTHKEYRISKGLHSIKNLFQFSLKKVEWKSILSLLHQVPLAFIDRKELAKLKKENA